MILFSGIIGVSSFHLLRTLIEVGGVMPALQIPRYWFQACITAGCLLMFLTQVIILINTLLKAAQRSRRGEEADI